MIKKHPQMLENGFYFTDDDVYIFGNIEFSNDDITFNGEPFYNHDKVYSKYPKILEYVGDRKTRIVSDTQCWIGKKHISKFIDIFVKEFDILLSMIKDEKYFLNLHKIKTSRSKRGHDVHFNFNLVLFNVVYYYFKDEAKIKNAFLLGHGYKVNDHRENKTLDQMAKSCVKKYEKKPDKWQPLLHFNVTKEKLLVMRVVIDVMAGKANINYNDYKESTGLF